MDDHRSVEDTPVSQRLTNDDFRKLLMTPRSTPGGAHPAGSVREAMANSGSMPPPAENKSELRRKKKSYYAALKKQEDTKLAELAEKYRDRARERRDGTNDIIPSDPTSTTGSAYRAVAPDVKSGMDAKERRRQLIQESKYLGGDMEHTHLVKGLDYALLQKVRSEIQVRETEQEAEMERLVTLPGEPVKEKEKKEVPVEEEMQFKTTMGKEIFNLVMEQKNKKVVRNELFAPGRMAYVVPLDEEAGGDADIPTTLTRSKADVPAAEERSAGLGDRVLLDKLQQIFSYLSHPKRRAKKNKDKPLEKRPNDESIYGAIGEYQPGEARAARDERPRAGYFDKPAELDPPDAFTYSRVSGYNRAAMLLQKTRPLEKRPHVESIYGAIGEYQPGEARAARDERPRAGYFDKPAELDPPDAPTPRRPAADTKSALLLSRLAAAPEGYAECYPGLREMDDAIDDSDDDPDYTKMDAGNKKGPIGRWDFDTQEEYSAYMSSKEALPKAAFQYGVKTQDGRKTRKTKDKSEKAELDREWQQIQNIIHKRKTPREEGNYKKPKY
ncbi:unnamed protein product [Plutella xylostella]|uniref:(diamondback moth) hypothetical protein n=1 Tax=Plutella xylostella TaxID=51655 RepID=A0A8S4DRN1_PLUXY|nr:unnamed protein product [Plutella xylostella]